MSISLTLHKNSWLVIVVKMDKSIRKTMIERNIKYNNRITTPNESDKNWFEAKTHKTYCS